MRWFTLLALIALTACEPVCRNLDIVPQNGSPVPVSLLYTGSPEQRYNIIIVGDGFQAGEQKKFNEAACSAVSGLLSTAPYSSWRESFNFWRINFVSEDSGISRPGHPKRTALYTTFGVAGLERFVESQDPDGVEKLIRRYIPRYEAVLVLANATEVGGSGTFGHPLFYSTLSPNFRNLVAHELGHQLANLADEYSYLNSPNDPPQPYPRPESNDYRNVTAQLYGSPSKWLLQPGVTKPTPVSAPPDTIGVFEGASYYARGIYRSQRDCKMRTLDAPFCVVCRREISLFLSRLR